MSQSCPLNFVPIDSNVSRINSLIVATLVISYVITLSQYILYFLIFDFILKLFIKKKKYSLVFMLALYLKKLLNIGDKLTDGGSKRLAMMFGFAFVILLLIAHFLHLWIVTLVVAGVFVVCLLLDVFFNYCIGCKIYYTIKRIYPSFMN